MKPMLQNWPWPADTWSDHVGFYLNADARLKIGNFQQTDIVHYVEKNKITEECIHILETKAWKL
jgi:putative methionine-R-sulfoxide reductase with GAF domain